MLLSFLSKIPFQVKAFFFLYLPFNTSISLFVDLASTLKNIAIALAIRFIKVWLFSLTKSDLSEQTLAHLVSL